MTKENIFKHRVSRFYKSFRTKVLMSFFAFAGIILIWVITYFAIQRQQGSMQRFENRLVAVQNHFLENHRNLESFILSGYRTPAFYSTGKQNDIDKFIVEQQLELDQLKTLKAEALGKGMAIAGNMDTLIRLNAVLLDSVIALKDIYYHKGFKYYGTEGQMWVNAHVLEDSCNIPMADLLQIRRREKDYMLRGDEKYVTEVNERVNILLTKYPEGSVAHGALTRYIGFFNLLVQYNSRLGLISGGGLYNQVHANIDQIQTQFDFVAAKTDSALTNLYIFFHNLLILVSVILIIAAILLSYTRSNFLTLDIRQLNKRIASFISSNFGEGMNEHYHAVKSGITEIDQLNKSYALLQRTLRASLNELESSVKEEKKASEYKSTFVANISHEIRTPLTGIIGMVHILKSSQLTADQHEMLETLDFSANHLRELINMVLDYSKIEAGKMEMEEIPMDLKGDVTKLLKLFEYKIIEKGLKLNLHYLADNSKYVIGDPLRLQQIFLNLLNNAIKFTTTGGIDLRVTQLSANDQEQVIRFEVEDTGMGIEQAEMAKLFVAFGQANTSISRNFGGTGLGLTITNQLVKMMGGQLQVQSQRHKGTIFSFDIAFKTGGLIKNRPKSAPQAVHSIAPMNILLAEDNPINQKVVSRMLQKYDVSITFANNGAEAVALFEQQDFDLIFMDIQMPELDGFEATQVIVSSSKYIYNSPPIVAFSANAYSSDRKQAKEAGMDDFLSKPIKPEELDAIIAKYSLQKAEVW